MTKNVSKKFISVILTLIMALSLLSTTAFAGDNVEKITTVKQLAAMSSGDYVLGANIEIDAATWTPVEQFSGTFDGDSEHYTITWKGTNPGTSGNFAIIANNSGTVKNLKVAGTLTVSGSNQDYFSAVVGTNQSRGVVDGVVNETAVTASGQYNVGGVVGLNSSGYILNCSNTAQVKAYSKVGGIVGTNFGTVNSCSNSAEVYAAYNSKGGAGGIAGHSGDKKNPEVIGKIWNCWNGGYIHSNDGSWMGGICGFLNSGSKCVNCFNYGKIEGHAYFENISGNTEGTNINCYGSQKLKGEDKSIYKSDSGMKGTEFVKLIYVGAEARWTQKTGCYPTLTNTATTSDLDPSPTELGYSGDYKSEYAEGTCFDPTNLVITATYRDGTVKTVPGPYTYTPSTTTPLTIADTYIKVSGKYGGQEYEVKVPITVTAIGFEIVMETEPTKTSYTAGESFDTTGMVLVAKYLGQEDVPITDYKLSLDGALTGTDTVERIYGVYSGTEYSFDINIEVSKTQSVTLGGSTAQFEDFERALDAVVSGGTITVLNTVQITEPMTRNDKVTVKSGTPAGSLMFNINTDGIVTLTTMEFSGDVGTIFQVQSGTLRLRGNVKLTNCGVGVDVLSGGALTVNKAAISATSYSIKAADASSNITLEDFGGISIVGNIYLGEGAVVSAKTALPCAMTFDMEAPEDGSAIIVGNGYSLQRTDAEQVKCLQGEVVLDRDNNKIYLSAEYLN